MTNRPISCYDCKYLRSHETGYSDWTPTGEIVFCTAGRFESLDSEDPPFNDSSAKLAADLEQRAQACPSFSEGEGDHRSVDEPWWDEEEELTK